MGPAREVASHRARMALLWSFAVGLLQLNSLCAGLSDPAPSSERMLPGDISSWSQKLAVKTQKKLPREWTQQMLDRSIVQMGNPYHAKKLLDKLNSGKRIIAVAFGSSFVHDFAGCWQPSVDALWKLGIIPNPMLYPQQGNQVNLMQWDYVAVKCVKGFMQGVMDTLNKTWPHPDHIFLNNGKGGACLDAIMEASCLSSYTPEEVDLVILDTVTNYCENKGGEKLVRRMLGLKSEPLTMFVSNWKACALANWPVEMECVDQCLRERAKGNDSAAGCSEARFGSVPQRGPGLVSHRVEVERWQQIAKHYGIPHLDLSGPMTEILDSDISNRTGMNKWQLVSEFYIDWVHLRKDRWGTLLVSDVIVHYLHRAFADLALMEPAQRDALRYSLPDSVVHPAARNLYHSRCYGMSLKEYMDEAAQKGGEDQQKVLGTLLNIRPGDEFGGFIKQPIHEERIQSLPRLRVLKSEGWEMQGYYKGQMGSIKFKPGWITSSPGAVLQFEVDTLFQGNEKQPADVLLTYIVSYDGWGTVRVSCVGGCRCSPHVVDAASKAGAKHSLNHMHKIQVTQHTACQVQLEMLQESSSGGHRFKLLSVMVRSLDASTSGLKAVLPMPPPSPPPPSPPAP